MATMDLCTEAVADATPPRKRSNSDSECGESGAADRKTKTPRTEPVPLKVGASPKPRRRGGVEPIDPNQPEGTVSYHTAAFSLIQVLDLWAKGHAYQPALVQTSKAIRNKKRHHPFKKQGPGGGAPAGPTPASISAISPATLKGLCAISATLKWKCIRGTSREQFAETADGEYFGPHLLIEGIDPPWLVAPIPPTTQHVLLKVNADVWRTLTYDHHILPVQGKALRWEDTDTTGCARGQGSHDGNPARPG